MGDIGVGLALIGLLTAFCAAIVFSVYSKEGEERAKEVSAGVMQFLGLAVVVLIILALIYFVGNL